MAKSVSCNTNAYVDVRVYVHHDFSTRYLKAFSKIMIREQEVMERINSPTFC
jgi:hypothetical protein